MSIANVFFVVCSVAALVGAVGTVVAKNPIRGAVGLLTTIIGIAGLFLQLKAEFLAAIQLIVYAGAVVVLFVFVIMLLGPDAGAVSDDFRATRARWSRFIGGALFALLALVTAFLSAGADPNPTPFPLARLDHGSVEAVGGLLFTAGLVPFELATALLIVAVVGAIAVARARHLAPKTRAVTDPTRLFHGPIHPRDAGRPLSKESAS